MNDLHVQLGDEAKDRVTGLTGTVTAIWHSLDESTRIELTPELLDGEPKGFWFGAARVEKIVPVNPPKAEAA